MQLTDGRTLIDQINNTGIQPPSAYGGHDYRRLLPVQSFYEAYDIGGARDLAMSLAHPSARQVMTLFPPGEDQPAEMTRARIADALAHGLWGVVVWSAGEVFRRALEPSAWGAELARGFAEFKTVGEAFAGAELSRSDVWLVESQASVRATGSTSSLSTRTTTWTSGPTVPTTPNGSSSNPSTAV